MNHYHKLFTPADSAVVFIDPQPQMTFGESLALSPASFGQLWGSGCECWAF